MTSVRLHLLPPLGVCFGGSRDESFPVDVPIAPGESLRALIDRLAKENAQFGQVVFGDGDKTPPAELLATIDGRNIWLREGMDTRVWGGEEIKLLARYG